MRTVTLLSILALSACASSSGTTGTPGGTQTVRVRDAGGGATQITTTVVHRASTATVAAPVDDVWRVLPAVYEAAGIPLGQVNTQARTIGNPGFQARRVLGRTSLSRYFDCGRTQDRPSAETYELHISATTQLQPGADGTTTVRTTLQTTARPVNFATGVVQCTSTGSLEARLVELIRERTQS
jgi:hypothetical protein